MTRGVLDHEGTKYCLVPQKRLTQGSYWEGGPTLANPLRDGRLVDPAGRPVTQAVAITESDVWIAHDLMVTIKGWPAYPFAVALLDKLPAKLVDRLLEGTVVHPPNSSGEVGVEITWDQLRISRVFKLVQLGAGVAIWPPKAIPAWKYYHFLFATGDPKLVDKRTELFSELVPAVYGYAAGGQQARRGETQLTRIREAAFSRIDTLPRWLTFESPTDVSRTHGILPIRITPSGDFGIPDRTGRGRSSFSIPLTPRRTSPTSAPIRLSVDFGTSNTAVAVRGPESTGLLPLDSGTRALNLTSPVNLDPTLIQEYANRFFALRSTYSNPLPTILFESHDVEAFSDSDSLPVRAIPEFGGFAKDTIQVFAREGYLKQDFKWKPSPESAVHRRAYLEQLAFIVGWVLRTNPEYSQLSDIDVIFSCPLAFTPGQTTRFKSTVEAFLGGLRSCGLTPRPMRSLVSESLANLCFVRENRPTGRLADTERHVVIDIGGGTTDISVFTGKGTTLLLDSLYIGGKDVAGSLLYYRIDRQQRWEPVAKALALHEENSPAQRGKIPWVELAQCLLINRMAADIDLLADDLAHDMPDLLSEVLTLLTFVTLYSVRMAALAGGDSPKATSIHVWYAGLGSRLFRLAPLATRQMNREESARKILERAISHCVDLNGIDVAFHLGSYSKESVCRGALLAAPETGLGDDLNISTVWWADVPSAQVSWGNPFDVQKVKTFSDPEMKELTTVTLSECYDFAVRTVGELTLDKFDPTEGALTRAIKDIGDAYARGCSAIRTGGDEAPRHPVRLVTDQIKESVCELLE